MSMSKPFPHEDPRLLAYLEKYRSGKLLSLLTAYDYQMATLLVEAGVDALLVGDSLGMVVQGNDTTIPVTVSQMAYHTAAVAKGAGDTLMIADLPAGSYATPEEARQASQELLEAGAQGVKFEGYFPGLCQALVQSGIPVMGHLGLLPQTAQEFKVQGKAQQQRDEILAQAKALEKEGAFSLVLECVPESLGKEVTESLGIPVIGIGAGKYTSGQVLVINDLLGLSRGRKAKFVPLWDSLGDQVVALVKKYTQGVSERSYPSDKETYH